MAAGAAVLPTIDGLIAATALVHGMTVVTRNATDMAAASALALNPWGFEDRRDGCGRPDARGEDGGADRHTT